jgi:hypothetical protein
MDLEKIITDAHMAGQKNQSGCDPSWSEAHAYYAYFIKAERSAMCEADSNVKRSVTITIPLNIAETLQGLVDGCIGSSEDDEFSKQMKLVLKMLDKSVSKHYA